jgi:carboxyl-terminal processing protease
MKSYSFRFLREAAALCLVLVSAIVSAAGAVPPAELLEKGIYTEETKGELKAAIEIYQQIVNDPQADRALVAQAQLRLGLCELKLGNRPQAISMLEQLDFPVDMTNRHGPQLLDEIVQQIEQNYIQEVDRGELMETALRAIVGKLDARGGFLRTNDMAFLDAREVAAASESIEQKIGGIGAVLRARETGEVTVEEVLPGSPASKGGLHPGDQIVKIDGGNRPDKLEQTVKLLRGAPGDAVTLAVKRSGTDQLLDLQLVRDVVRLPSVFGDRRKPDGNWDFMMDRARGIGYIRLTYLGKESPAEVQAALDELQRQGMKGLILDLRNNPGGLFDGAVAVADLFIKSGRIVSVKSRTGEKFYDAKSDGTFSGFPMAVLVNHSTASAAEIIASCLQDQHRAVIAGERTFGQALVRELIPLKGGGALKLPVAAYYRPSGKTMNRYPDSREFDDWGVMPDPGCEVAFSAEELNQYWKARGGRDPQASNASLPDAQLQKALDYVRTKLEHD